MRRKDDFRNRWSLSRLPNCRCWLCQWASLLIHQLIPMWSALAAFGISFLSHFQETDQVETGKSNRFNRPGWKVQCFTDIQIFLCGQTVVTGKPECWCRRCSKQNRQRIMSRWPRAESIVLLVMFLRSGYLDKEQHAGKNKYSFGIRFRDK